MAKRISSAQVHSFTAVLERSDNKLWGCHFPVPVKIADTLLSGTDKRVICSVNGLQTFQCAILFYRKGKPVISVNKKIRDALHLDFGMEAEVTLTKDQSEYGLPMPEELLEVFRQDPAGKKLFHALTPGKQRTLLYIIGKVKDQEKRIHRALVIVRHLHETGGSIDYKKLGVSLKEHAMISVKQRLKK